MHTNSISNNDNISCTNIMNVINYIHAIVNMLVQLPAARTLLKIGFQDAEPGAELQFLLLDCRARACTKGLCFSQTPVLVGKLRLSSSVDQVPEERGMLHYRVYYHHCYHYIIIVTITITIMTIAIIVIGIYVCIYIYIYT